MTSLFTLFVARGAEVPAVDPRLTAHVDTLEVVTNDNGPAASVDEATEAEAPGQPGQQQAPDATNDEGTPRRT